MTRANHFERFEDHTLLKHFIVGSYLKAWATILLEGRGAGSGRFKRAVYVDAFAGEGCDAEGNPGSPLLATQIASEINGRLFKHPVGSQAGMQVIAIEQDHERFTRLVANLERFTAASEPFVIVREGNLNNQLLADIRALAAGDPILYFLDPFGISGLDAELIPSLLADEHSELLMLFSDEGAVRLHGKGAAVLKDPAERVRAAQNAPSLFGAEHDAENVELARRAAARVAAGHKSDPRAREIMLRAFGGEEHVAIIETTPVERRQYKMIELYSMLLKNSGAKRVLRFAVATDKGRHKYTLLHASKQPRAFAVMKDVIHRARNKQGIAAQLLTETPLAPIVETIRARFAGQVVRWQGTKPSVQQLAIDETDLMYHECDSLKRALDPFVVQKRPLTFQF